MRTAIGQPRSTTMTIDEVAPYLVARGLLPAAEPATVEPLGGGVSNAVFAIDGGGRRLVLKQAMPRLRVADVWEADPSRAVREGVALRLLHALTPASVPDCVDVDEERFVIVLARAPEGWVDWKSRLLAGDADPAIAGRLGRLLATWHAGTVAGVPGLLHDRTAFEQLRVEPYYRTVMARRPDVADAVGRRLQELLERPRCIVHGDFSPKNVLAGGRGDVWVLDWEVAHVGDPGFDVAYLLTHLLLKSIHREADRAAYARLATDFLAAYGRRAGEWVALNVGCLALARVDGKSPATYLTAEQRARTREVALRVLHDPPADVVEIWRL